MKVVIVEDERLAVNKLRRLLAQFDTGINVLTTLGSVEETINWFSKNSAPDLIFMDVQLEDGICFEIFENIQITTPIIFTTAFDEYAIDAFQTNSVDYLLKPIEMEALLQAITKYKNFHVKMNIEGLLSSINPKRKERFLIKVGDRFKSIQTIDVNYFYIREKCSFLNTSQNRNYAIDFSLDKVETQIDPNQFFRINRTTIVNYTAIIDIIAYSNSRLKLKVLNWDESILLVSRERVVEFKQWMNR